MKKTIILLFMLALTISCNSGDDYVGKWYNKNNNIHITIIKAGDKGCIIRIYGRDKENGQYYDIYDYSNYFIYDDGYFYKSEENRKKGIPNLILQDKNHIIDVDGNIYTKI